MLPSSKTISMTSGNPTHWKRHQRRLFFLPVPPEMMNLQGASVGNAMGLGGATSLRGSFPLPELGSTSGGQGFGGSLRGAGSGVLGGSVPHRSYSPGCFLRQQVTVLSAWLQSWAQAPEAAQHSAASGIQRIAAGPYQRFERSRGEIGLTKIDLCRAAPAIHLN